MTQKPNSDSTLTENADDSSKRQLQQLNQAVGKLSKSIKYWETWEEEYEVLREALQDLDNDASDSAVDEAGIQSVGELLDEKEINLLLRDEKCRQRAAHQIIGLLSRRIEYVQSNIISLRSQLQAAEGQSTASQAPSQDQQDDEVEYPLMEIQEELDEDDNVISSLITPANAAAPQVVEALRKAGLNRLPTSQADQTPQQTSESRLSDGKVCNASRETSPILKQTSHSPPRTPRDQQLSPSTSESDSKGDDRKAGRRRKSVTFADGTKQAPPTPTEPRSAKDVQVAKATSIARRIKAEVRGSIDALKKVHNAGFISDEVFDRFRQDYVERLQSLPLTLSRRSPITRQEPSHGQDSPKENPPVVEDFKPVMPTNESPEDAALRREMIRYNMNEVGAVVAEMTLDDNGQSDRSNSGESNDEGEDRDSSDEDEDRWGMSARHVLSNDYIKEMRALEQKLNAQQVQNTEPSADIATILQAEQDLEVTQDGNRVKKSPSTTSTDQGNKAVRFANTLDIQERPPSPGPVDQSQHKEMRATAPLHTDIVERSPPANDLRNGVIPTPKKKASRFKSFLPPEPLPATTIQYPPPLQTQASNGNQVKTPSLPAFTPPATPKVMPTGPPGRTHAPNVIERPYSDPSTMDSVSEPDEFDVPILQQELMTDYHRTRTQMIQRQGGFLASEREEEEAEAEGPLVDENGKKISRFKAARLKALGVG
ncbi:MAG: hypothetical protein Q9166_004718 [cf. Caloplaca sp. 2 TL-2023]